MNNLLKELGIENLDVDENTSEIVDKITKENYEKLVTYILDNVESPSADWIQFIRPKLSEIFEISEQEVEDRFMSNWFNTYTIG